MKTILYLALTANGMIAAEDDSTDFVSERGWKDFSRMIAKTGNIIIGRRTYEVMVRNNELKNLKGVTIIIVTTRKKGKYFPPSVTASSPKKALALIQKRGLNTALVAGGAKLNSSFLSQNIIDEMYLYLEPALLGAGIPLLAPEKFSATLKLLEVKKFVGGGVRLHYNLVKPRR